jgi:hypothetical protein
MTAPHPKTCRCGRSKRCDSSRPGRHPGLCQCRGCTSNRVRDYFAGIEERKRATREACDEVPTRGRPVFVRGYWRRQKNFKKGDPALRAWLFDENSAPSSLLQ